MPDIQCFMIAPNGRAKLSLRRFTFSASGVCPASEYHLGHDVSVPFGYGDVLQNDDGTYELLDQENLKPNTDDPRWPTVCSCGYEFKYTDTWQLLWHAVYVDSAGTEYQIGNLPPGAMFIADWLPDTWRGDDGLCLCLQTPGGQWVIDQPDKHGGRWTRTGTPPNVTATPSIIANDYHGWLRDGVLVDA